MNIDFTSIEAKLSKMVKPGIVPSQQQKVNLKCPKALLETDIENPSVFTLSPQQKELQTLYQYKKNEFMLLIEKAKWIVRREKDGVKIEDTAIRANQTTRTTCVLPFSPQLIFRVLNDHDYW